MNGGMKEHWETVYDSKEIHTLGWYEESPEASIRLISKCPIHKDDAILDTGVGASTLIDYLVDHGYKNIIALDISERALGKLRERLGEERSRGVEWIVDDITKPGRLKSLSNIALWHDRALLHFLLREEERKAYLSTLRRVVKKGGYVIIACFSITGAKKCSGLDVMNYDRKMLSDFLGEDFKLIEYFDHVYHTPSGAERPYIYTLFKRTGMEGGRIS